MRTTNNIKYKHKSSRYHITTFVITCSVIMYPTHTFKYKSVKCNMTHMPTLYCIFYLSFNFSSPASNECTSDTVLSD